MRVTLIEGTPEEILELMPHLRSPEMSIAEPARSGELNAGDDWGDEEASPPLAVSVRVARKFLSRAPLNERQRTLFRTLYEAYSELVSARQLQTATGYSPAQFAGLMGALGRRLTHTEGYVDGSNFFTFEWDEAERCWLYGMTDEAREAVRLEGIV